MVKQNKQKKEKANPILWFFFAIVIPIVVAITLTVIIFSVAGVNVMDWVKKTGNNIPVISSVVTTDEEKDAKRSEANMQEAIDNKDAKIEQLTQNVTDLEATIDRLEQDIAKLENNSDPTISEESSNEKTVTGDAAANPVKTIASSYKEMDSEQAAKIIEELNEEMAISILNELPNDTRGSIFDEMDPKKAAQLTQMFINSGN
ncbi:MotE family protein [Virgibacillus oceani]|uniref:Magnesium transporter MgtE intracellular domain-containing protein n=1 Tax=Virgibacillus oceani TaxID=1479511 RepID=A0A917H677_9BACI|nr:hypothetical protein [Virgibacillus oceani]GGG69012.1 hypothetical protein GCM10011398_11210 [Virgibacillus oceani]